MADAKCKLHMLGNLPSDTPRYNELFCPEMFSLFCGVGAVCVTDGETRNWWIGLYRAMSRKNQTASLDEQCYRDKIVQYTNDNSVKTSVDFETPQKLCELVDFWEAHGLTKV